jgi:hypothetical protein
MLQWAWAYFTYQRSVRLITQAGGTEEEPGTATARG